MTSPPPDEVAIMPNLCAGTATPCNEAKRDNSEAKSESKKLLVVVNLLFDPLLKKTINLLLK
jgi:hypothetical protein